MLKTILRYAVLTLTGILAFIILFALISVAPVDRTPVSQFASYPDTFGRLAELNIEALRPMSGFSVGYGKSNITPPEPVPMAGYGKRKGKSYRVVHDSIFVRSMVITNGTEKVAIVSADLLIIPPTVTRILSEKLAKIGFGLDNTYLSATHSHNSIGQWSEGATRLIYGPYDHSIVSLIADGIVESILAAVGNLTPSEIKTGSIAIPHAVENRLIDGGIEDPYLRVLEVKRTDSTTALLATYAAHATCLSSGIYQLSRDYPGILVDSLEARGYDFAMFLAGGVGSHKGSAPEDDWACMAWMAQQISDEFFQQRAGLRTVQDSLLVMARIPLSLSPPQIKITENWKLRSWVFNSAYGEYDAFLTALRIGDVVMLGTPCDFSGEFSASLDSVARQREMQAIVTSFNGGYIGYLTPATYYDLDHYETRIMNWYAPGTGEYVKECLARLIIAMSDSR